MNDRKKVVPHDGLEVGKVVDDDYPGYELNHGCRCNCGEAHCFDKVWRIGDFTKCAVCEAVKAGTFT